MPTDETELMELLRSVSEIAPEWTEPEPEPLETGSYLSAPQALLSAPPISLADLMGAHQSITSAVIAQEKRSNEDNLANAISLVDDFLSRADTDLFGDSETHYRRLGFVYTVV